MDAYYMSHFLKIDHNAVIIELANLRTLNSQIDLALLGNHKRELKAQYRDISTRTRLLRHSVEAMAEFCSAS
jgi:hypothetical protein